MHIEVQYETKNKNIKKDMFTQQIQYKNIKANISQKNKQCILKLDGDEDEIVKVLRIIWELLFLYDGYFYIPIKYIVDGQERNRDDLYFLPFYRTGKMWMNFADSLIEDEIDLTEERLSLYDSFRNTGRESGKLFKSLINSFYYMHSEAYEKVNSDHRLTLFLNICDGLVINTKGKTDNVEANIGRILGDNLDIKLVKYGISLLGVPKNKLYEILSQERNEIAHFALQKNSVAYYMINGQGKKADYINMYLTCVVELALRIAFLKLIGFECSKTRMEYAMNEINDWIILSCDLDEECKNSCNKVRQDYRRRGIDMHK